MTNKNIILYIIIVLLLLGWSKQYRNIERLSLEIRELSLEITEYQYALEEANENIEEANSIIEDAQSYAWSSYNDMGYALDNLYTVDTVWEP